MGLEAARGAAQSLAALQGAPAPVAGGASEAISAALGSLTRAELFEIMGQMKGLVVQNPGQARTQYLLTPCSAAFIPHKYKVMSIEPSSVGQILRED